VKRLQTVGRSPGGSRSPAPESDFELSRRARREGRPHLGDLLWHGAAVVQRAQRGVLVPESTLAVSGKGAIGLTAGSRRTGRPVGRRRRSPLRGDAGEPSRATGRWKRGRVMQYESAHIDGVESEVGVRSSHSSGQPRTNRRPATRNQRQAARRGWQALASGAADALVRVPRPDHRDPGLSTRLRASRKSFPTFVVYGQPRSSFGSVERRFRRPDS
jgi:hypothetical protein